MSITIRLADVVVGRRASCGAGVIVVPPEPHRPAALQWQVFRGSEAIREGLLSEHQLRSAAWLRLRQDVYADARLERDHLLACRAVALRIAEAAVIAGPSAAYLLGVQDAAGFADDVHVVVPSQVRVSAQRGVRVHVTEREMCHVVAGSGLVCSTAGRVAWDVAAWLPPVRAVPIIDAMLYQGLVKDAELREMVSDGARLRGVRLVRAAVEMADGATAKASESRLRVRLLEANIPRPVLNHPVLRVGDMTIRVAMAWPAHRVALEYEPHRMALLTAAGWLVILASPARVRHDFPTVLREIRQSLRRRGA